jgi:hypothetical protein
MSDDYHAQSHANGKHDVLNVYWRGLESLSQGVEPMLKNTARCNLELVSLASRRAQAYFNLPAAMGRCRSPQDLLGEQVRFWQTAAEQYADTARNVVAIWSSLMTAAAQMSNGAAAAERDFITFAEPREDGAAQPARKTAARRAA